MALTPGTRLGPYEVTALIGVGGMGEVYRATDTHLKRSVAIKVLPASVAADAERLARLQREAEVLAALNHPNIAQIHGLEKSGGTIALVMELVEGPTLADLIAQAPAASATSESASRGARASGGGAPRASNEGAIPLDEALPIAKQIADALEAAHERGIIHRDLKPANVKVRSDGMVKVLDFGLAKAMDPLGAMSPGLSQSPTITTPAMTQAGMILGTAAYMSPEQARGKPVDKRADIWAFGAVLFEMLTGTRAFPGEDLTDTLAAVVKLDPKWDAVGADVPARVRQVLRVCLQKDPKQRAHDIADIRLALEGAFETAAPQTTGTATPSTLGRRLAWSVAGMILGGLIVGLMPRHIAAPLPGPVSRFTVTVPSGLRLSGPMTISPDGTTLVYSAGSAIFSSQLYARRLAQLDAAPIRGAEGGLFPFFSPDGTWVAFRARGAIKRVPLAGGEPVTVTSAADSYGGVWLADDTIVFASEKGNLVRVSASGGEPRALTKLDSTQGEFRHILPAAVPGGRAVLFTVRFGPLQETNQDRIEVVDLETGARRVLIDGTGAQLSPGGAMVFVRNSTIWAVPFDSGTLELRGSPSEMVSGVAVTTNPSTPVIGVGSGGSLAYEPANAEGYEQRALVWVDRTGREQPIDAPARAWWWPTVSPDGRRLGVHIMNSANMDGWIYDLDHGPLTRVTYDPLADGSPLWSPDGKRVVFWSFRAGPQNLYWRFSDLTGRDERLTTSPNAQRPFSWARNGELLVFEERSPDTKWDIGVVPVDGDQVPRLVVRGPSDEMRPSVSPDGRWLAYQSNLSGQWEVFVQPFPELDSVQQVSSGGGVSPLWGPGGRELFYRNGRAMVRVPVEIAGKAFRRQNPEVLFEGSYVPEDDSNGRSYALAPGGQRFLMMKSEGRLDSEAGAAQIVVVTNWSEELKRLVPAK